ncbi:hypothetical protein TWF730_002671 [Orbilia blumenaviensis]|uniref:N-acetyltransferase domain-containing protein n=1 Tax=Orbilia blumenaviensis TaxID=1796055 RepID=A0AAV9U6V3_9PEZI
MATALMKRALNHQSFPNSVWRGGIPRRTEQLIRKAAIATSVLHETYVPEAYHPVDISRYYPRETPTVRHNHPVGFKVREARYEDTEALTRLWFSSSNLSSDVDPGTLRWWNKVWAMGIHAGPRAVRTFVAENSENEIVAFSRWNVPQADGSHSVALLPDFPDEWGADLTEALWENATRNRKRIMGRRPHWRCEFIAVDPSHQEAGLASMFMSWGCQQADTENLEVYIDRYITDLPVWKKEQVRFWSWDCMAAPSYPDAKDLRLAAIVRPSKYTGAWANAGYVQN